LVVTTPPLPCLRITLRRSLPRLCSRLWAGPLGWGCSGATGQVVPSCPWTLPTRILPHFIPYPYAQGFSGDCPNATWNLNILNLILARFANVQPKISSSYVEVSLSLRLDCSFAACRRSRTWQRN
jgi:hypothetical protein